MKKEYKYIREFSDKNKMQLRSSSKRKKQTLLFVTEQGEYLLLNKADIVLDLSPKIPPQTIINWRSSLKDNDITYSEYCKQRSYL